MKKANKKKRLFIYAESVHIAINLQGGEPVAFDYLGNPEYAASVHEAVAFANDYDYTFQYCYDPVAFNVVCSQQMTKAEFKKAYHAYRLYMAMGDPQKTKLINKYNK